MTGVHRHLFAVVALFLAVLSESSSPCAQISTENRGVAQEIQIRGYWIDPSTGLIWTAKDNGNDISWGNAVKHCQNLRLAGYSDWRLPSIDELQNIYDGSGFAAPHSKGSMLALAGKVKGGLFL